MIELIISKRYIINQVLFLNGRSNRFSTGRNRVINKSLKSEDSIISGKKYFLRSGTIDRDFGCCIVEV